MPFTYPSPSSSAPSPQHSTASSYGIERGESRGFVLDPSSLKRDLFDRISETWRSSFHKVNDNPTDPTAWTKCVEAHIGAALPSLETDINSVSNGGQSFPMVWKTSVSESEDSVTIKWTVTGDNGPKTGHHIAEFAPPSQTSHQGNQGTSGPSNNSNHGLKVAFEDLLQLMQQRQTQMARWKRDGAKTCADSNTIDPRRIVIDLTTPDTTPPSTVPSTPAPDLSIRCKYESLSPAPESSTHYNYESVTSASKSPVPLKYETPTPSP